MSGEGSYLNATSTQGSDPLSGTRGGGQTLEVDGRPVSSASTENQPSAGAMEPRTSFTELARRIATVLTSFKDAVIQHFTSRTESKPVTGEAAPAAGETSTLETAGTTVPAESKPVTGEAAPAARETPAEAPTISNPIIVETFRLRGSTKISDPTSIIKAGPPSPDAAGAGYKTTALVVGETPVRIYAKNPETLGEIRGILSDPGLLSGDEMIPQFSPVTEKLQSLGFKATNAEQAAGPFCAGGANATGYMEGNEAMRQRDLQGTEKDKAGPFSIRQPPDKARIAGAKVLKEMNSWLQTLAECADRCTGFTFEKTRQDNRKQVMEKLIKFCNAPESQVATLERCVKGNNLVSTERVYSSFPLGFAPIFRFLLRDSKGEVSSERLKELAGEHGHKFVKQMVTTAYRAFPGDGSLRQELKAVYEKYCRDTEQILTNLDEPLFNNDLKTLFNERDKAIAFIKEMNLSPEKKAEQIELCQKSVEQRFQTWLGNHTDKHDDGSVTINVGHMKIMVNEDQLNYVTLASLGAL